MSSNYTNPLPGVPHVESPFFGEIFVPGDEYYDIARSLHDKGYAVFDFPDPDIVETANRIKRDLEPLYQWDKWRAGQINGLRIQDAWETNEDVRRVACHPKVIRMLSALYGRDAFPFQTLNFPVGTEQHYHTDSVHFSARPERFMCGVWLALEDIGPDQGPLVYYPGSHKWPIYTNEHIGHFVNDYKKIYQETFDPLWERLVDVHDAKPERLSIKAGQALIWASNLLHGGDRMAKRDLTRWSQVTHYYFKNCSYYTPISSNEGFGETFHRRPKNILNGEYVDCFYNGRPVPEHYIANSSFPQDFEPDRYLTLNPDVAESGADPIDHYRMHGRAEGRPYR